MNTAFIKEKLSEKIESKRIFENESMSSHTTFRCGGNSALFVVVNDVDELRYVLSLVKALNTSYLVLGNGSNTLFSNRGYDGVVIKLSGDFNEIIVDGDTILAGSGALLSYVSKVAATNGLSGMEALSGIPGSIGGAIYMNAGAYDHSISEIISTVTAIDKDGDIFEYDVSELEMSYRHSLFSDNENIIISCKLQLHVDDTEAIESRMSEYTKRRKEKQPLSFPSAGSFFKRPEGHFAGALIEETGLKGLRVGGAEVSTLHAGFIINSDNATADDVIELSKEVIEKVYEKTGVKLQPEVRIIGE